MNLGERAGGVGEVRERNKNDVSTVLMYEILIKIKYLNKKRFTGLHIHFKSYSIFFKVFQMSTVNSLGSGLWL